MSKANEIGSEQWLLEYAREHAGYKGQTFDLEEITKHLAKVGLCPIYHEERFFVESWG